MKEKYIENYIRKIEYRKLILAFLFVGVLIDILVVFELKYKINKVNINDLCTVIENMEDAKSYNGEYVNVAVDNLIYTGYDATDGSKKIGSIYAYENNGKYLFIVLDSALAKKYSNVSADADKTGIGNIDKTIVINSKVIKSDFLEDSVYEGIANALGFESEIINNISYDYALSVVNIHIKTYHYISGIWAFCFISTLLYIIGVVYIIIRPFKYKKIIISPKGDKKEVIADADNDMVNNLIDYYENTYITTKYQIRFKKDRVIIKANEKAHYMK